MKLRQVAGIVARVILGAYLVLAVGYKLYAPADVLGAIGKMPITGALPFWVQRAVIGLLIGVEASVATCLLANRCVHLASALLIALLFVVTVSVGPSIGPNGCACNWSWIPFAPTTMWGFMGRNLVLALLAFSLLAPAPPLPRGALASGSG